MLTNKDIKEIKTTCLVGVVISTIWLVIFFANVAIYDLDRFSVNFGLESFLWFSKTPTLDLNSAGKLILNTHVYSMFWGIGPLLISLVGYVVALNLPKE